MSNMKMIRQIIVFTASFVVISVMYQNCGSPDGQQQGATAPGSVAASNNGDIVAIPNTKTASVQRASRVLDNLVSCLGTGSADDSARTVWNNNRNTISEEGLANTMTQPMAKALIAVAAEVCEQLVNQERNLASEEKRIFVEVDLNAGDVSRADMRTASKRLARSCWGRNASNEELSMIVSDVTTSFQDNDNNGASTRTQMIYMCTAMAASFAAFEM